MRGARRTTSILFFCLEASLKTLVFTLITAAAITFPASLQHWKLIMQLVVLVIIVLAIVVLVIIVLVKVCSIG